MFKRSRQFLLILLLCSVPAAAEAVWQADSLPDGWELSGQPLLFEANDLYGYINGGSELFLEFGFRDLRVYRIRGADQQLSVDVYRMTDNLAALGIYLAKCSPETPLEGVEGRNSGDRYQLALLKGNHFVFINNTSGDAALLPVMKELATALPADWRKPEPQLPDMGTSNLITGSLRLARGPYALQPVYTLGDGDVLHLEEAAIAVIGDYRKGTDTITRIVVEYRNEESAADSFSYLLRNLDPYLSVLQSDEAALIFRDYADEYGQAHRDGKRLTIDVHLVENPVQEQ